MVSVSDLLGSIRKAEQHAEIACIYKNVFAIATSTSAVVGSVAFEKQVRKGYKLQNCSGLCRMSSFLKDPQCVAATYQQAL